MSGTADDLLPARQRRWPRRLLIGLNVFVALCLVVAGAGYGYIKYRFGQVKSIDLNLQDRASGDPENVLIVGSDSRADLKPGQAQAFGTTKDVSGQRSDVTMILHIDPKQTKASVLSIPRDTYVPIAGTTRMDRINSAFEKGPQQLVATLQQDFGISVNHYVEVNFDGFRGIVDAIGGVQIYFPAPARDAFSGLKVDRAGCTFLSGAGALAYVRSRHYQYYEAGRWHEDPTSDIGRIQRQQDFIRRVLRKIAAQRNPLAINNLVGTAVHDVTIDSRLSAGHILSLARRYHSLSPDAVDTYTLPGVNANIGGAAVLRLKQPEANQTLDQFLGRVPPPTAGGPGPSILPNSVRVRVLNGTGGAGEASAVASQLQQAGFSVAGTGDADSFRYINPVIRYGAGQRDKALLLQSRIAGTPQLREDLTLRGIDLVLVTGSGFGGIRPPPSTGAPGAAGTTTMATTTTTGGPLGGKPANRGAPPQPQC